MIIAYHPSPQALAYLAMIPEAARHAASVKVQAAHARTVCGWVGSGAILFIIIRSRALTMVQPRLAAGPSSWATRLLTCLLFAALFAGLHLPITGLELWLWPGDQTLADGLASAVTDDVVDIPLVGGALFIGLAVARCWPRRWALALGGFSAALIFLLIMVAPVTLIPWGRHDALAPAGAGEALLEFARRGGLDADRLYQFVSRDPADVDMEGLWGTAHAAVSQAALRSPTAQTYAAMGHLLGHHHHKDLWGLTALWCLMAAGLCLAFSTLEAPLGALLGDPRRSAVMEGRSLPVLALIGWACLPIFAVTFNVFDQVINYRADAYALSLTHDRDGLCRWLVAIDAQTKADPSDLEALMFYDHPPLARRLDNVLAPPKAAP